MQNYYCISFQNGHIANREHNNRNPKVIKNQKHIDPNGYHVSWVDEKPRDAYIRLFEESIKEYNEKQTRKDRKINNYYNKIKKSARKNTVYEVIVQVGNYDNPVPIDLSEKILHRFVDDWNQLNPNLELIGAYFHADEYSPSPHLHLDYIPVAHNYKTGPETQTGLAKAFSEMGYEISFKNGKKITGQIKWEQAMRDYLEKICHIHNLAIIHPQAGSGIRHVSTSKYVENKINSAKQDLNEIEESIKNMKEFQKLLNCCKLGMLKSNDYSEIINRLEYLLSIEKKYTNLQKSYNEQIKLSRDLKDQIRILNHTVFNATKKYNEILQYLKSNNISYSFETKKLTF